MNHTTTPRRKFWFLMNWVGSSVITKISHVRLGYINLTALHHTLICTNDKCKSPRKGHISDLKIWGKNFHPKWKYYTQDV